MQVKISFNCFKETYMYRRGNWYIAGFGKILKQTKSSRNNAG